MYGFIISIAAHSFSSDIILTAAGASSRPGARVSPPAGVAVSSSNLFGDHDFLMAVEEES